MEQKRLKEIFDRCSGLSVAVVGDLMLDVYLHGTASRLSQEAPVPVLHAKKRYPRLGGAANVMRNLMAFKSHASAFGVVGRDASGDTLRKLLEESGVDASGVFIDPSRPTTEKLRVLAGTQQLVRIDFEEVAPIARSLVEKMAESLEKLVRSRKVDAVIFEDYAKGLLDRTMVQYIVNLARENGVYTSLDPHPGHPMEVKHLSLMTPNRAEAFGLAGMYCYDAVTPVENDKHLREVAKRVLASWQTDSLLITLGAQGMALFKDENPALVMPTIAREVFDVSGAGDTVIATYTMCVAAGATEAEAADIANHAAGIVVGKLGTATATREEVIASFAEDRD